MSVPSSEPKLWQSEVGTFVHGYLGQSVTLLEGMPYEAYGLVVAAVGGSVGGHLRHCLEHVQSWLEGLERGTVYFEDRSRDRRLESDRDHAVAACRTLAARLSEADEKGFTNLKMLSKTSLTGDLARWVELPSSAERELVYVGLHFVHHMALMATAARLQGLAVPEDFGVAPATLAHRRMKARILGADERHA